MTQQEAEQEIISIKLELEELKRVLQELKRVLQEPDMLMGQNGSLEEQE